jgi:uncharacterized protein (DUF983 family)
MMIATTFPHSSFGDPECCGCFTVALDGDIAHVMCNQCEAVVSTVPAGDVQRVLDEMEIGLDLATAICPHCRNVNLFPGFTKMIAFVCHSCGNGVTV